MLYAPTSDLKEDWIRDLQRAISGDFPQEQKDKSIAKQGQELTKKRDEDVVRKIHRKKKGEEEEEEDDDQSNDQEPEPEQEAKPEKKERKKGKKKKSC